MNITEAYKFGYSDPLYFNFNDKSGLNFGMPQLMHNTPLNPLYY